MAMDAAESVTIRITAIDSLNSCCRLGQTTSFNSSIVEFRKPLGGKGFSSLGGGIEFGVSSGVELATNLNTETKDARANALAV